MPTGVYIRTKENTGWKHPIETRKKMSEAKMGNKYCLGVIPSKETREKQRQAKLKNPTRYWLGKNRPSGENNPLWKGGYENKLWHNRQRRILKLQNSGSHTQEEWENLKNLSNLTCVCCKKREPEITLTVDHIVPVSRGGSDNIENLQPLCKSCNSKKHDKIIKYEL
jgi:5-methylcytosine-specific restriction endonuclease McrA